MSFSAQPRSEALTPASQVPAACSDDNDGLWWLLMVGLVLASPLLLLGSGWAGARR